MRGSTVASDTFPKYTLSYRKAGPIGSPATVRPCVDSDSRIGHPGEKMETTPTHRPPERPEIHPSRWLLIRDALVFQVKLFLDGVRDFVMMPISLGVAVLDLLGVGPRPGRHFYGLLEFGHRTEKWINLFGAREHVDPLPGQRGPGVDRLVERMERLVTQEYERGGITASAKDAVDRALDGLQRKDRRSN